MEQIYFQCSGHYIGWLKCRGLRADPPCQHDPKMPFVQMESGQHYEDRDIPVSRFYVHFAIYKQKKLNSENNCCYLECRLKLSYY